MIRIFFYITIAFSLMLSVANGLSQSSKKTSVIIKTKIYCDHCADCESCKPRIEHDLSFAKGVKSVLVDVKKEEIKVIYNPAKTTVDEIRKEINKAGFDADDKIADAIYVKKLDDCCRKPD